MIRAAKVMNQSILQHIDSRPFKVPSCAIFSGPSGSGKSHLIKKILDNRDLCFDKKITHTVFIYKEEVPIFDSFPRDVCRVKGLITDYEELLSSAYKDSEAQLFIIDDHQNDLTVNELNLANILCSKYNTFLIILTQNIFPKNKYCRELSRSAGYFVLFPNKRDSHAVSILLRQLSPASWREILNIYNLSLNTPFRYTVIDIHPHSKYRILLRDSLFYDTPQNIYYE